MNIKPAHPEASLRGKTVVITGATSGVGRAAAILFGRQGAKVVLAARREGALSELVSRIESLGGRALAVQTDVTDAAAVKHLAEEAALFGQGYIDVWINNAGVLAVGAVDETPMEVQSRVVQTNLLGYLHGAAAVIPFFKSAGKGVLINNISVGGRLPVPYGAAYSASKFGLRGLTGALQAELSGYRKIHVCGLYPAMLNTPGVQHAANYSGAKLKAAPPVFDPERVAGAMVKLALHPRRSTFTDLAAPLMQICFALAPRLVGRAAEAIFSRYFRKAPPAPAGSGNLFDDDTAVTSVHGGWAGLARPYGLSLAGLSLAAASIVAGGILLRKSPR